MVKGENLNERHKRVYLTEFFTSITLLNRHQYAAAVSPFQFSHFLQVSFLAKKLMDLESDWM